MKIKFKTMKNYSIPITWQSYKRYDVQAENLKEAVISALNQFLSEPDETYINDSFDIDSIILEENPNEIDAYEKAMKEFFTQ